MHELAVQSKICGIPLKEMNIYIVIIYRSRSGCFDIFLCVLEEVINAFNSKNKIAFVVDFNVHFGTGKRDCTHWNTQ